MYWVAYIGSAPGFSNGRVLEIRYMPVITGLLTPEADRGNGE